MRGFKITGIFLIFLVALNSNGFDESNCRFPENCYGTRGNILTHDENGELLPECAKEAKSCPEFCKDDGAILDEDGQFTGKYKKECMSDSRANLELEIERLKLQTEKDRVSKEAAERKRIEKIKATDIQIQKEKFKTAQDLLKDKKKFARCFCNLNSCLGKPTPKCASVTSCKEISSQEYSQVVLGHKALLILNSRAYCADPMAGFLRGN